MIEANRIRAVAALGSLETLRDHAAACAGRFGCSPSCIREIALGVEEALVNIFTYAYEEDTGGEVEMTCEIDAETLRIVISDTGRPFDPVAFPPPLFAETVADRRVGGMGIPILRRYADGLAYKRDGNRNVLMISITRRNASG